MNVKNLLWTLLIIGPAAAWAQAGGNSASPDAQRPAEAPRASTYLSSSQNFDGSLELVRNRLGLTPEQQPLWRAYESAVDAYTGQHYREMPVFASQEEKAPRQIGKLVDVLQNRLAALENVEQAAKDLYASLLPEQQKTANQMLLSTVPTFVSSVSSASPSPADGGRKGGRSDGAMRSRRGGGMGGGAF